MADPTRLSERPGICGEFPSTIRALSFPDNPVGISGASRLGGMTTDRVELKVWRNRLV